MSAKFPEIVQEHQKMVFSIAYHFLRDSWVAEELAQDVFLHLYQNLNSIESPSHLKYWLRKVISHRCIDQSRRQRLRPRVGLDQAPEPVAPHRTSDPMLSGLLRRMVASLPPRSRMIVVLRFQEEMEPGEIAATMDIPLGTVKSNLHRALAVLRGKMERESKGVRA